MSHRLLNPDGTFNVTRQGTVLKVRDLYHSLLTFSWPAFLGLTGAAYAAINAVFALGYVLCGPDQLTGLPAGASAPRLYREAFFFSVQTLATIGYGKIAPAGLAANVLVTLESLTGLLGIALVTGLIYARFSRPTARLLFSDSAVVARHDGVPSLLFRIANLRQNQIVEAQVKVTLVRTERTAEGEVFRNFHFLELERSNSPLFVLSWTVVHPITEQSPLHGLTREDLERAEVELLISVTGIDDTFSQTIHARKSYVPAELRWGERFADILDHHEGKLRLDLRSIHRTIPEPAAAVERS